MKIAICCAGILLAACAAPPHIQAQQYSSPVLCYGVYAGNSQQQIYARQELLNRRFNCTDQDREAGRLEWAAIQGRRQAEADRDLATGLYLLNQSRPPPPKPVVNCRTVYTGNVAQTVCN